MSKNFKTYSDAFDYCDKFNAPTQGLSLRLIFEIAEALLQAYKEGADNKPIHSPPEKPTRQGQKNRNHGWRCAVHGGSPVCDCGFDNASQTR